jgi:hypothetical protein
MISSQNNPGYKSKKNEMGRACGSYGLKDDFGGETCEHSIEPSDSIKHGEFLD